MMPPSEKNEYVGFRVAVSAQEAAGAAKAPSAPTTPPSNLGKFSGSIKAVDVDGKKISCLVKEGNQEKELTMAVADDSKITLNGNGVKLADLKAGDEVECEWAKKDDAMITNAIAAMRGGRTGGGGTLRGRSVRENLGQFRKDFQEFNPGSDTTYNWLESINEGLEAMKEQKSPGLFYFYSPADKSTAFLYETQIFPQFSRLGAKFVTVKINSQDEKALAPFQKYKGRTCVAFLDPRGKLVQTVSIPNPMTFRSTAAALESKYAR
jgi:hypothetical protein